MEEGRNISEWTEYRKIYYSRKIKNDRMEATDHGLWLLETSDSGS